VLRGVIKKKAIKQQCFLQKVTQSLTPFIPAESPILLLPEGIYPLKATLAVISGSSQGIKEEISMVRKEVDTQFLEPDRLKMNKTHTGYTLLLRDPFSFTCSGS